MRACDAVQVGVLLHCDVCGKDFIGGDYLKGHKRIVQEGLAASVLFVLIFL